MTSLRNWSTSHTIKGWKNWGFFQPGEENVQDVLASMFKHLMGKLKKISKNSSLMYQVKWQEAKDTKWNKIPLNKIYCEICQTSEQVAKWDCGFCVLGDTQKPNGYGHEQRTLVDPALSREVEWNDLHRHFPTPVILWFSENCMLNE